MLKPAFATALALAMSSTASAEPREHTEPTVKSESAARSLSLYGTLASATAFGVGLAFDKSGSPVAGGLVLVGGAGLLITPSLGHWYAEHYVSTGLVIRVAGATAFAYGLERTYAESPHGTKIVVGSLGIVAVGAIVDIATTGTAVRRYNANLHVAPIALVTPSGPGTGVAVAGTF